MIPSSGIIFAGDRIWAPLSAVIWECSAGSKIYRYFGIVVGGMVFYVIMDGRPRRFAAGSAPLIIHRSLLTNIWLLRTPIGSIANPFFCLTWGWGSRVGDAEQAADTKESESPSLLLSREYPCREVTLHIDRPIRRCGWLLRCTRPRRLAANRLAGLSIISELGSAYISLPPK
jgi:hypothetical protein